MSMNVNSNFDGPSGNTESLQWDTLQKLCRASVKYFTSHRNEKNVQLKDALLVILEQLDELQPLYNEIAKFASHFDFDEKTPGNGYRSFLLIVDKCIALSERVCQRMYRQRNSVFFRRSRHIRKIEACCQLLVTLHVSLQSLKILYTWSTEVMSDGKLSLFIIDRSPQDFLNLIEKINQYCFYGRYLGFQYCSSLKRILRALTLIMVSYSEKYYNSTVFEQCVNSINYFLDPEAKARRIVNISQFADVSFIQALWSLSELKIVSIIIPSLTINQIISVPPDELILPTLDDGTVSIPIPNSHIGKQPIYLRLLSSKRRLGMIGCEGTRGELHDLCDSLIIHTHGGAFIAQTSQSHLMYLQKWATMLDVPILSIDYNLAPQAPYPRALEEIVYAYAWALKHASTLLGSTAKKVIFVGDSAGGILNLGATLKCLQLNIKKPDGIFMAYAPVFIDYILSPSHMLFSIDTLLLSGFVVRCLRAYAGSDNETLAKEHESGKCAKSNTESSVSTNDLAELTLNRGNVSNLASSTSDSMLNSDSLTEVNGQNDKLWSRLKRVFRRRNNKNIRSLDEKNAKMLSEEIVTMSKDPFLSPYIASDDMLVQLPPIKILALELDPCLDDCIMFAKKLRLLGNKVTLDILPDLPHGFLYFSRISKEAMEGTKLSARRIKELLEL